MAKGKSNIEITGVSELLQKIEKAGGKVEEAVRKCVENSLEQVGLRMQLFMMEHKFSGDTYESYEVTPTKIKKNGIVEADVGYNIKKGGLPAIFLDVGTPTRPGYFFRQLAIENSREELRQIQKATLEEILEDLN